MQGHFFVGRFDISRQIVTQKKTSEPVTLFGQSFTSIAKKLPDTLCSVSALVKMLQIARHTGVGLFGNTYNANTAATATAAADTMDREAMLTAPLVHVLVEFAVI